MSEKPDDPADGKPKPETPPGGGVSATQPGRTRNTPYPPTSRPRNTPYPPTSRPRNTPQSFPKISTFSGPPSTSAGDKFSSWMKDPQLRQVLTGIAVGLLLAGIVVAALWLKPRSPPKIDEPAPTLQPAPVEKPPGERPVLSLPHPEVPRTVPDAWRGLALGMREEEIASDRLRPVPPGTDWAQKLYQVDAADPLTTLGLSFHEGRLYRIVQDFTEDPYLPSSAILPLATAMYPKMQLYEYNRGKGAHMVMIHKTESRVFQLDFLRNEDGSALHRAELIDVEVAQKAMR